MGTSARTRPALRPIALRPIALRPIALLVAALLTGLTTAACGRLGGPHISYETLPLSRPGTPGSASWSPWPQALHDAQHSASSTAEGPTTGHVRWKRTLEGDVTPGPVVAADGTIYAASSAGVLHAIDPKTGADRWKFNGHGGYGSDRSTSPAVLPDGTVLWPGPEQTLFAVTATGQESWRVRLDGEVSSPVVTDDGARVVVGDTHGTVVALDVRNGAHTRLWQVDLKADSYGSPVLSPDASTVYQTTVDGLAALSMSDGDERWTWHHAHDIVEVSAAVAPDGTVVVGTNDPFAYGVAPDGSTRWKYRRSAETYSSAAVSRDGVAYFGDHAARVTGLDAGDGRPLYRYLGPRTKHFPRSIGVWTSPAVDRDHRVYVGTRQGLILGADADGHQMFQVETGATVDSYPALTGDGALVVGDTSGTLWAVADH